MFISSCEALKQNSTSKAPLPKKSPSLTVQKPVLPVSSTKAQSINPACKTDSDCVLVDKGCCNCANGGDSIAIHKSQKNNYISKLKKSCSSFTDFCMAEYRCDYFKAKCMNFQCVAVYCKTTYKCVKAECSSHVKCVTSK